MEILIVIGGIVLVYLLILLYIFCAWVFDVFISLCSWVKKLIQSHINKYHAGFRGYILLALGALSLWCLITMFCNPYSYSRSITQLLIPSWTDVLIICLAISASFVMHIASPWKRFKQRPEIKQAQLSNPSLNYSTPSVFLKAVTRSAAVFGISKAADLSGFSVFMLAAKLLGPIGLSFNVMKGSMIILGFALQPWVYVPAAVILGMGTLLIHEPEGNKLLSSSMNALYEEDWQRAYNAASQAFHQKGY